MAEVCSPVQGKIGKKVPSGEMTLKRAVIEVGEFLGLCGRPARALARLYARLSQPKKERFI
jgi:hypothetical protein